MTAAFIIAGQSNAIGIGRGAFTDNLDTPAINARIFQVGRGGATDMQVIPATEPLQHWPVGNPGIGFAMRFARLYVQANNEDVLLIPCGKGRTSIADWAIGGGLFNDMMTRAWGQPVVGILWQQGEADRDTDQAVYEQGLVDLFAELHMRLGPIPILAGEAVWTWRGYGDTPEAQEAARLRNVALRQTIHRAFAQLQPSAVVDAQYLKSNNDMFADGDVNHFCAASQIKLANRYYAAWEGLT